ncbi:MAG: hypothetical protein EA405_02510 [Rhodospirillales bacterium]|nr:MAG: hypothetical protein EA405_02510 [Rhodospirillales bacterium]
MTSATFHVSLRACRSALVQGWDAICAGLYRTPPYRLSLAGRTPDHLDVTLPISWPDNPAQARAILDGRFQVEDREVTLGNPPWPAIAASPSAAAAFHAFAWLDDLRANGSKAAQLRAQALIEDWIDAYGRWRLPAWQPRVLAQRLAAWLSAADFLLAGANAPFPPKLLRSTAMQARHLVRVARRTSGRAEAFSVAKARLFAAVCLDVGDFTAAERFLVREIDHQILPDGGHVQRAPSLHLAVLRDLLDMRTAYQAARREPPPALGAAIDRMVPALRAYRAGDGGLVLFHGGKEGDRRLIDAVIGRSGQKGRPQDNGRDVGFQRLAAGRTVLVFDVGPPPPGPWAHAAPLAFEMSVGRDRVVTNCGDYTGDDARWRTALRSTDAHSTLIINGASVLPVADAASLGGPRIAVNAARRETEGSVWVEAAHDGYRRAFGLLHRRRLYIDPTGDDVRGEDVLDGTGRHGFKLRFHLHPAVAAELDSEEATVRLRLPTGGIWRFLAVGGRVSLDDSVYLGSGDSPRPTSQIVVSGAPQEPGGRVKWAFRRDDGPDG